MKFIQIWNNFMFSRRFNYFDVISLFVVTAIAIIHGYWWFLLYIPLVFISVLMEMYVK